MTRAPLAILVLACGYGGPLTAQESSPAPDSRPVSLVRLVPNLLDDQKRIYTSPAHLFRKRHLLPVVAVLGITAALIETDSHTAGYFRDTHFYQGFNSVFSSMHTAYGIGAAPLGLYAAGLIGRRSHEKSTALLAGEALLDSEILTTIMKDIDRRRRPWTYPPGSNFEGSWFSSHGSFIRGNGSFPSGHTIGAVSVATVIARRYPKQRWVPYAAYGLAGVVAFSRLSLSAHFLSDDFMGAALGYAISRFAVLHQ